ncbi:MAG: hypothetical protein LCH38_14720 [Proteobacteria bacterium]|nr:hypothetical protein [Pseudomonadota bacterium]
MTDYYPLLQRAIAGKDAADREAIYARARSALERQLRGFEPPLTEEAIAAELTAIDAVALRIEGELNPVTEVEAEAQTEPEPAPPEPEAHEPVPLAPPPLPSPIEELRAAEQAVIRPRAPMRSEPKRSGRSLAIFGGIAIVAMVAMGMLAMSRKDTDRSAQDEPPRIAAPTAASGEEGKTEGRLGAGEAAQPPARQAQADPAPRNPPAETRPAQPPAQPQQRPVNAGSRAFVVLEVAGSAPNQFEGKVEWSFLPDPALRGQKSLRARIDFSGSGLKVDLSIARNSEAGLNASHIVMAMFEPGAGVENIREMSAIEWRGRESEPGSVFAGMVVPVQDNVFMIGLDRQEASVQRNLDLLRNQKWLVFEVRLANGRRGAVLAEKGVSGDKAVAEALAEWK